MNHTFDIKTYEQLEKLMNDTLWVYCKGCKKVTYHLKCGFGDAKSMVGNGRVECLKCNRER